MTRGSEPPPDLSPPISFAGAGGRQGPCWVRCPAPRPPRCPPAPRSSRKVGGLEWEVSPWCCLSPPQGLPTAMGHWLLPCPQNQPPPASPSCQRPPSSPSLAPPVSTWGPSPAPCPTPCPPSPRSAPTAPPRHPPLATGSSDGVGGNPLGPPYPAHGRGDGDTELGTRHRDGFICCRGGDREDAAAGPALPLDLGGLGDEPHSPGSPQQGGGSGPSVAASPPASTCNDYSQAWGAKAKGHSLYPAPT